MDRTLRALGIVAVLLVAVPQGVRAAEEDSDKGALSKLYAGLGVVGSVAAFDLPSDVGQQDSWGLDARVGYRLLSHLALEADYQWAARYELTSGGVQQNTIATHAVTGNAKVPILSGPIEPYLLVGLGFVNAQFDHGSDHTEAAFRVGGGLQVLFGEHFGAYGEITYLKPFTALNELNSVPIVLGGLYRF